jgi:GntR family transcriptional repressor for pyruvate dehydrogenase complex
VSFIKIKKNTAPMIIVKQIIESLENGEFKSEEKLPPERDLAKAFGVGRTSIREAIRALVVAGYLEVIQGKGIYILHNNISKDQHGLDIQAILEASPMFDLVEARKILEIGAVRLAAERADAKQLKKVLKVAKKMEDSGDDIRIFYEADLDFHLALAEASGNAFINKMMKMLIKALHKYSDDFLATSYETKEKTILMAKKILQLIDEGNGEEAALCMGEHLGEVDTSLKDVVLEKDKKGVQTKADVVNKR